MSTGKVDAAIVGSGASGSLLAAKLAQTGKKVLVLEAGPGYCARLSEARTAHRAAAPGHQFGGVPRASAVRLRRLVRRGMSASGARQSAGGLLIPGARRRRRNSPPRLRYPRADERERG